MNILIVVAHPDDETIGMGGTIKKLSKNNEITLCVMTDGASAQYDDKTMIKVRQDSCKKSIIGAGSVVLNDVKPNSVYIGNPAKFFKKIDIHNRPKL